MRQILGASPVAPQTDMAWRALVLMLGVLATTPIRADGPTHAPLPPQRSDPPAIVTVPSNLICADPRLKGTKRPNVVGDIPGCGIFEPVRISEVAGVKLSTPALLDCRTARTFANWVIGVAQPEARRTLGSRIDKLWLMGTYACRTRNNRRGTRLSEHAVGRAIDIGGMWLADGRKITVLTHWADGAQGKFLQTVWRKACGPFTTVLGPKANRFHLDHLHFDTAYRNAAYCR